MEATSNGVTTMGAVARKKKPLPADFGDTLQNYRIRELKLTVTELAERLSINPGTLRAWENGTSWPTDVKLGNALIKLVPRVRRFRSLFRTVCINAHKDVPPPHGRLWTRDGQGYASALDACLIERGYTNGRFADDINVIGPPGRGGKPHIHVTAMAVSKWRRGVMLPVKANADEICRLLPEMKEDRMPDRPFKNIDVNAGPLGCVRESGAAPPESKALEVVAPEVDEQPPSPEPLTVEPPRALEPLEGCKPRHVEQPVEGKPSPQRPKRANGDSPIVLKTRRAHIELPSGFNPEDLRKVLDVLGEPHSDES